MRVHEVRDFSKRGDALPIPNLIDIQIESYQRFLQKEVEANKRKNDGLEALLREVFPIESYDQNLKLEYISYDLAEPRYTTDECRALRLTFGMPFRIQVRLIRKDKDEVMEDSIYLGEIPIMIGGGEFIINGAERVIVSQLHRSPGVDFLVEVQEGDRPLHGCRIIPERGSWIECSVTKKDVLAVRIDQSSKIPATTFLRALDEKYSTTEQIIREFYTVENVKVGQLQPTYYAASPIIDAESGEEVVKAGAQVAEAISKIQSTALKSVECVTKVSDPLILNTLAEDTADSHKSALLKIYARLRPGNPPQEDKAKTLFQEKFFDENRYRLGRVGRFRINRKFDQNVPETVMTLRSEDLVNSLKYMFKLRSGEGYVDDIDHLGNRRLRTIDELASEELRKGFLKLRRTVQERMSLKDPNELGRIAELVNSKSISSAIDFFFGRGELSQVVDQTNPLSQLTHERRLSALGPGGLNRKRAGFEVRDVHISHYGRICPIETPEGTNIGLIASLAIYADIDDYGFLITPYRVVKDSKVNGQHKYLRADEEMKSVLAPPDAVEKDGHLSKGNVLARVQGDLATVPSKEVEYIDISPRQTVSVSASLIPFLEHDDANRALMGSNMQRQAVPLLRTDPPVVATGMEKPVAQNSGMVVRAERGGVVTFVDALRILIDNADEYILRKFVGLNERTCLNQRPIVRKGQRVKKGQIIADGAATHQGELALGRNVLVAFLTYDGYNFEDAIVISQRLVKEDIFTSIHIEEYDVEIRETKLGREEFTRDIPNVSERALANLDENGVVRVGTRVGPGDILVGKVAPKSKSELTPEEKLLHAIFGRAGEDVKNDSLEMPAGEEGVVIGASRFSRRMHMTDEQKKTLKKDMDRFEKEMNQRAIEIFKQMIHEINEVTGQQMVDPNTKQKVGQSDNSDILMEQIETFSLDWVKGNREAKEQAENTYSRFWPRVQAVLKEKTRRLEHMKRGDELPSGVLEMVKIYVATKRQLSVGDKMAGRHGNKGVIARIVPEEDMPFLEDGTPVDILLNPLGVPSRMNVGQILETHLGWAAAVLGFQAVTPVFDGGTEDEIHKATDEANKIIKERRKERKSGRTPLAERELDVEMPWGGKVQLHDGRTGEAFEQKTTVGFIYMMKLHHLVDDKIHARATGPYSLITQQPLGGKARTGGQRFGEMEVWGLEAYGAAYILQELLTVKSDDVEGRTKIYESMVKGTNTLEAGTPVSFDVLCNEIRGLGLNIQLEKKKGLRAEDEDGDLM
ncbi:MAG TPA: DNA-directed RNA polymerase subunit beta [Tepidisphaeraceae bacterium]|jgi:DNA-directed RNA polymerase subunit beta|nr:DNA-directed RNA polymerase subunit beta [Tepidisphaeraceae bacterium]